jgi:hypothetical protein
MSETKAEGKVLAVIEAAALEYFEGDTGSTAKIDPKTGEKVIDAWGMIGEPVSINVTHLAREIATVVERDLTERVKVLEEALRPFAEWDETDETTHGFLSDPAAWSAAKAALATAPPGKGL